jgi:hypothetical protein
MFRRPPKYHHYWPTIAQMPPLKHSLIGKSEVLEWLKAQFEIDDQVASAVFSSSKQAKYIVQHDGRWQGDARSGYQFWKNGGKAGEKTGKPKQSHDEMMSIPEYAIMLDAVTPLIEENQRNLTEQEAKVAISALWPNDPLCAARRRLALRLYRNWLLLNSDSFSDEEPVVQSPYKETVGDRIMKELKEIAEGKREINIDDKPMSLEEAKANFQRIKESLGL